MSWAEHSRDSHNGVTYATYRCELCKRWAVVPFGSKPGRCCCATGAAKEKKR